MVMDVKGSKKPVVKRMKSQGQVVEDGVNNENASGGGGTGTIGKGKSMRKPSFVK